MGDQDLWVRVGHLPAPTPALSWAIRPKRTARQAASPEALDEIEDDADDPLYRARWFYEFTGGCVRYDFDAEGEGAQSVDRDVAAAIGMYPMEALRELAREAGYRGFE